MNCQHCDAPVTWTAQPADADYAGFVHTATYTVECGPADVVGEYDPEGEADRFDAWCRDNGEHVIDNDGVVITEAPRRTTRERRMARAERLRGWAEKREARATAAFATADTMASAIPFGQPILVGHYSEGRDRRYRDRIGRKMDDAVTSSRMAESMASRAANIEAAADHAIYSDDPDAIDRLTERIAALEVERDRIKAYNASCRKGQRDVSILTPAEQANLVSIAKVAPYSLGKKGEYPRYHLTNLSGNIARQRNRLNQLVAKRGAK